MSSTNVPNVGGAAAPPLLTTVASPAATGGGRGDQHAQECKQKTATAKGKTPTRAGKAGTSNSTTTTSSANPSGSTGANKTVKPPAKLASKVSTLEDRLGKLEGQLAVVVQFVEAQSAKQTPAREGGGNGKSIRTRSEYSPSDSADTDCHYDDEYAAPFLGRDMDENSVIIQPGQGDSRDDKFDIEEGEVPPSVVEKVPNIAAKFAVAEEVGPPIDPEIAKSTAYLLTHQLEPKVVDETITKYPIPSNCELVDVPKVNQRIWNGLPAFSKTRDLKFQRLQKNLTRGINAYIHTVSAQDITEQQQDALALLCSANFELNSLRKEFMKPDIGYQFQHLCKPSTPVSKFLFGDDLGRQMKDIRDEQKATEGVLRSEHSRQYKKQRFSPYDYGRSAYGKGRSKITSGSSNLPQQYRDAGWTTSRASTSDVTRPTGAKGPWTGATSHAFLGQRPKGRGKPSAPHTFTHPSQHQPHCGSKQGSGMKRAR